MDSPFVFTPQWIEQLTQWIVWSLRPASVLHLGCGQGELVRSLRAAGVPAWGIDLPERLAAPDDSLPGTAGAASYCQPGEYTRPLDRDYDLVVCLEVAPALSPAQADVLLENLSARARQVLFSAAAGLPQEPGAEPPLSPGAWAARFARHGLYRSLEQSAPLSSTPEAEPWVMLFRQEPAPLADLVEAYEDLLWQARQERLARRGVEIDLCKDITRREYDSQWRSDVRAQEVWTKVEDAESRVLKAHAVLDEILASNSFQLMQRVQVVRRKIIPLGSRREQWMDSALERWFALRRDGLKKTFKTARTRLGWKLRAAYYRRKVADPAQQGQLLAFDAVPHKTGLPAHTATVDVVVCVHNALADVQNCLASVRQHSSLPYSLILVDDGSGPETCTYLAQYAAQHDCQLIRNEQARGYTFAANQGLRVSTADFVILLNSDTIVTEGWLDRMVACAETDPKIGVVGPLSNTASWQSIPELSSGSDWADNPLPPDISVAQFGALVARYSGEMHPQMKLLNGFCLMIRRGLIDDIGYFDEETFGGGYGEEDDYNLRAQKNGWKLALADDVYIYHAQSKSYSHERRKQLSERAGQNLANKHGRPLIDAYVQDCLNHRVLQGIRTYSKQFEARHRCVEEGRRLFSGRRVLFLLPTMVASGGGNIVFSEARAMRLMGVDVQVFNLPEYRKQFLEKHPNLDIPVIFDTLDELPDIAARFDAVIATINTSVAWLLPLRERKPELFLGYYVQGFEPLMYEPDTEAYQSALDSYTLIPGMARFTKTEWTRDEVLKHTGAMCDLVGPSVDLDLFRPRPRQAPQTADAPVRVGAMVRVSSPYRAPILTMQVLRDTYLRYGPAVEIVVFGSDPGEPGYDELPSGFPWKMAGLLSTRQVASYMNEIDIFADFSSHQAMGLAAMEAMACGVATIVPANGGVTSYAVHGENALIIDTSTFAGCFKAIQQLVEDRELRLKIQRSAIASASQFFPEKPALEILKSLFKTPNP